ncbi:MAG: ComEC family competence protein [Candidatus Peribacteraceae bacterium]|nr:ComEC family competence protein [Candidatus Peribacteraceae bacterium]
MRTSHIAIGFTVSFLTCVFALRFAPPAFLPYSFWIIFSCIIIVLSILCIVHRFRRIATVSLAIVLGIGLATWRVNADIHTIYPHSIENFARQQPVTIHGVIVEEPDTRAMQTKFTIEAQTLLTASGETIAITGRMLATDNDQWPEHNFGDSVDVYGKLERPKAFAGFAYDDYLSTSNIYAIMYRAKVTTTEVYTAKNQSLTVQSIINFIRSKLYSFKEKFEDRINRIFPEPHASLLAGLLTGSRRGIPDHLLDNFRIAGLLHIVAISGYNITIIIALLSGLLFWLPLKWRFVPLTIGIILFTIFVGASASVVRAAIMGVLGLFALQMGRVTSIRLLILWTATFMTLWNPKQLWFDTGFQMSFLAVIGLAVFSAPLKKIFKKLPEAFGIRESLIATMAAQITTTPLSIISFGQISLISPIANLLVAPLIPLAMLSGFLGITLSHLSFPLGQIMSYVSWGFLEIIIRIVQILAMIPYAALSF